MDVTIYPAPNPALTDALISDRMRRICEERANTAMLLYQAEVAKRTGALATSAHASTEIGGVKSDRWIGVLTVGGRGVDYAEAHEFGTGDKPRSFLETPFRDAAHDLNVVLENLQFF